MRRVYQGMGIGRQLINEVIEWSKNRGDAVLSLTTFLEIPFNAPFYQKIGFKVFVPSEDMVELCNISDKEQGWDVGCYQRVCMRLSLN